MGKRRPVHAKKAWAKLDTSLIEKANLEGSNALLRNAEPKHKGNEELFFVDTKGSARRPGRREPWELKSTSIIKANPKIPVIPNNSSFKKLRSKEAIRHIIGKSADEGGAVAKPKAPSKSLVDRNFDLWGDEQPAAPVIDSNQQAWLSDQNVDPLNRLRASSSSKKSQKTLAAMKPEPSVYTAVEVPHAGAAYRPRQEDQQELIGKVAAKIVDEEERNEERLRRLGGRINVDLLRKTGAISKEDLPDYFRDAPADGAADAPAGDDEDEDGAGEADGGASAAEARTAEKLSRTQRNKMARHRQRELAQAAAARAKRQGKDLNRVDELGREVSRLVAARDRAAAARAALKPEVRRAKVKRLGKHLPKAPLPAVQLPEETAPRLRLVKPDSKVVMDRFRSMQLRNLIETRLPARRARHSHLQSRKIEKLRARAFIE